MSLLSDFKKHLKLQKQEMQLQSIAIGLNSSVSWTKDEHIVLLDYDVQDIDAVEFSIKEAQQFWRLGDAHIIKTRNGYHAYFFTTIVPYGRLKQIIEYARDVDPLYKSISKFYDHKTIRVAGKYKDKDLSFVKVIRAKPKIEILFDKEMGNLKKKEFESLSGVKLP
jgi:hypothetical protein